jgi:hypothetical protein
MPKQIVLLGETLIEQEGGSSSHSLRTTVAVGADGTFALPALAIGQWRSAFVPAPPPPPGTDPEDLFVHARSLPALRVQLGTDARIDLGGAQALRLQFAAADNTPCSGAWVIAVVPPDSAGGFQEFVPLGRTDELGRFAATLPPDEWVLFVYDDAGSVLLTFDPVANAGKPLQLVREPFACMRLQVVDQAGKPVGGARAKVSEMIGMGRNARIEQARGDIAGRIDSWQMEKARSDAEGRLDLRYLPTPRGQVTFRLEVERGGEQHRSNRTLMDDRGATTQVVIQ